MNKLVLRQEEIINDIKAYFEDNNLNTPLTLSALATLDNMNQMQEYYVETIKNQHSSGERILRLYALFQGLFVCIDALYSLAYYMSKSKTFININQNKQLKEIRYIRNDVVGHPVNRVYEDNQYAYCVLDQKNVFETKIVYDIYIKDQVRTKEVDLIECLNSYYTESNDLLSYLHDFQKFNNKETNIISYTKQFYDEFELNDYDTLSLKDNYQKLYHSKSIKQSRFLWRLDLLQKFKGLQFSGFKKDLYQFALKVQVKKLLEMAYLLSGEKIEVDINYKFPRILLILKRFLLSNKQFVEDINILIDPDNHFFSNTLDLMLEKAVKTNNSSLVELFNWIKESDDNEFIYLITSTFKQIKLK